MSKSQEILNKMNEIKKTIFSLKEDVKVFLADKSIPVNERWKVFCNLPDELYEHDSSGPSYSNMGDLVMYDGLIHAERYQTINTIDMVEKIEKAKSEIDNQKTGVKKDLENMNIDMLKEEIMVAMDKTFKYDW